MTPDAGEQKRASMRHPHVRTLLRKGCADERASPRLLRWKKVAKILLIGIFRNAPIIWRISGTLSQVGAESGKPKQ
jgi:hypothetical protein